MRTSTGMTVRWTRIGTAVLMVMTSPEYLVQR
jgi:hypothetical protein